MRIKFHDNKGSQNTLLFSPEILFFRDGSLIMLETTAWGNGAKYELPLFSGESDCLWLDLKKCSYSNNERENNAGSFKVVWKSGNTINVCRYKEVLSETFWQMIKRKISEIA